MTYEQTSIYEVKSYMRDMVREIKRANMLKALELRLKARPSFDLEKDVKDIMEADL